MANRYEDLLAWQKAMMLAEHAYRLAARLPSNDRYGLFSQIRRSAISVPSNIAEGQGRITGGEFRQFLGHARGSLFELETQIDLSARMKLLEPEDAKLFMDSSGEVARLLNGLISSLK